MKLRELLEQIGNETGTELSLTINPGAVADEILNLELWLVNYKPTPRPLGVVLNGVVYLTNEKENG